MDGKCRCGYYHYTTKNYQQIHGESNFILLDPYLQAPLIKGELWDESKYDSTEPYPTITWTWICQFCGNEFNSSHREDCYWLEHQK